MQSMWSLLSPQPPLPLRNLVFLSNVVYEIDKWSGYKCLFAVFNTCCTLEITVADSQLFFL